MVPKHFNFGVVIGAGGGGISFYSMDKDPSSKSSSVCKTSCERKSVCHPKPRFTTIFVQVWRIQSPFTVTGQWTQTSCCVNQACLLSEVTPCINGKMPEPKKWSG